MFAQLAHALAAVLTPLRDALTDPKGLDQLLASAGWVSDEPIGQNAVDALADALEVVDDLDVVIAAAYDVGDITVSEAIDAIAAGGRVFQRLYELGDALADGSAGDWDTLLADTVAALPPPFDSTSAVLSALDGVVASLVTGWLVSDLPALHAVLRMVGVVAGAAPPRPDWTRLVALITDSSTVLSEVYGWADSLRTEALRDAVLGLGGLASLPVRTGPVDPVIAARYWGEGVDPPAAVRQYDVTLVDASLAAGDTTVDAALRVVPVPDGPGADPWPTGVLLAPIVGAGASAVLHLAEGWTAASDAAVNLEGTAGIVIRPGPAGGVAVEADAPDLAMSVTVSARDARFVIGDPDGIRVTVEGLLAVLGVRLTDGAPEPFVTASPAGSIVLTVAPPESGGFLRFLIGDGFEVGVDADLDISASGLVCGGTAGLGFSVPLGLSIGPLRFDRLDVALTAGASQAQAEGRLVITLAIGPLIARLDGLGAALIVRDAPAGDGALGRLDVGLTLLPPNGIGFEIHTGVVEGGGFVQYFPETGRYLGGLSIDILSVGIDALVIVDTQLPNDPDGWAFFASLTAQFPGIPLGFGFTLEGVGGLIAINRALDVEALALGLRTGAVDDILFPDDPVGDALQLAAQIDEYFPFQTGTTVVGPIIEIGWGSPTLITAQLGVVISLPDGLIAVLGSVAAFLPDPDAPVLELHMDTLGVIDVPGGTFWVLASLYDSTLLETIHLSGDMATYLQVGAQPYFLLSVGGYHPGWDPPSCLPAAMMDLRRMQASIEIAASISVSVQTYFAITSNSVQFGASVNVVATVDVALATYTALGWFGFDVLITFSPFSLSANMYAGVGIYSGSRELMGVQLNLLLEGPKPWYAIGTASFKFFGLKVNFELEVGGRPPAEAAPIAHPRVDVLAALRQPGAWREIAPTDPITSGVTYINGAAGDDTTWVRPDHLVAVRQGVAPLNRRLEVVGNSVPAAGENLISIADAGVGTRTDVTWDLVDDWFAPAQFEVLGGPARLTRASYELMDAGVSFGMTGAAVTTFDELATSVDTGYEEDEYEPDAPDLATATRSGAVAYALRNRTLVAPEPLFTISPTSFTVAQTIDGDEAHAVLGDAGLPAGGVSQYAARAARTAAVDIQRSRASKLVVVPATASSQGIST